MLCIVRDFIVDSDQVLHNVLLIIANFEQMLNVFQRLYSLFEYYIA